MRIAPSTSTLATAATASTAPLPEQPAPAAPPTSPVGDGSWTNPAAAAALRSSSDLLQYIEDGMVRNFRDFEVVRGLAGDLRSTNDILRTAMAAISTDASPENDAFLPLLDHAGQSSQFAYVRLASKDIGAIWPIERSDILAAVRRARSITRNVADQLDPRPVRQA